MRIVLALVMLLATMQTAQAACIIDINNNVVCDDQLKSSQGLDAHSGISNPNARVQSVSPNKGIRLPADEDAPINLDGRKPSGKKEDCREVAGSMISVCGEQGD